jgi:hypothetical protein
VRVDQRLERDVEAVVAAQQPAPLVQAGGELGRAPGGGEGEQQALAHGACAAGVVQVAVVRQRVERLPRLLERRVVLQLEQLDRYRQATSDHGLLQARRMLERRRMDQEGAARAQRARGQIGVQRVFVGEQCERGRSLEAVPGRRHDPTR